MVNLGTHEQYATGFTWLDVRNKVDYPPRVKTGPSEKITSRLQGQVIRSSDLEVYELGFAYSLDKMIKTKTPF